MNFRSILVCILGILAQSLATEISQSVRLKGGNYTYEGRVEIYHKEKWYKVCYDGWNEKNAKVVCRMLGFSYGEAQRGETYGSSGGLLWIAGVECLGNETSIINCGGYTSSCTHGDAGVICYETFSTNIVPLGSTMSSVETNESTTTIATSKGKDAGNTETVDEVMIILGIVVVLISIISVLVVCVFLRRKRRNAKNSTNFELTGTPHESPAYENNLHGTIHHENTNPTRDQILNNQSDMYVTNDLYGMLPSGVQSQSGTESQLENQESTPFPPVVYAELSLREPGSTPGGPSNVDVHGDLYAVVNKNKNPVKTSDVVYAEILNGKDVKSNSASGGPSHIEVNSDLYAVVNIDKRK